MSKNSAYNGHSLEAMRSGGGQEALLPEVLSLRPVLLDEARTRIHAMRQAAERAVAPDPLDAHARYAANLDAAEARREELFGPKSGSVVRTFVDRRAGRVIQDELVGSLREEEARQFVDNSFAGQTGDNVVALAARPQPPVRSQQSQQEAA